MLLFISHSLGCQYYIGRYADDRFTPETHGRMTWVDRAFFAPESLVDERGRRIMWAWIFEGRPRAQQEAALWAGTMSLPRVLWLGDDKTLRMAPPEELTSLRLRVFIDRSVVEVFANERQVVMRRIYPTRQDSVGVRLFARGGAAQVRVWRAWEMDATNVW